MHSLVASAATGETAGPAPVQSRQIDVDVISLPEYLTGNGLRTVDILKLDVEGSELDVLEGMGERLPDVRIIVGELHETHVDPDTFYRLLERHAFRLVREARTSEDHVRMFEVTRAAI
jgi:hypothetical protein